MNSYDLGRAVSYYRNLRGLTQVQFANALYRSTSWVKKLEAGERQADPRFGVLEEISRVLNVSLEDLLKIRAESRNPLLGHNTNKDEVVKEYIRNIEHVLLTPTVYLNKEEEYSLERVQQGINYAWTAYQASHYLTVSELLPDLLIELYSLPSHRENLHLEALLYRLICLILLRFGAVKLGIIAAKQALNAALEYNDPYDIALACWVMIGSLSLEGKADLALEIAEKTLTRVSDHLNKASAPGGAALGAVFLQSAIASSVLGNRQEAMKFLEKAKPYADKVGKTDYFYTDFGHANIKLHEFSAYSNLGMYGKALEYETFIDTMEFAELKKERSCHFLVDLAYLHWKETHYEKSALLLKHTARLSDQELKAREEARDLLHSLRHDISKTHFSTQTAKFLEELHI